MDIFSLAQRIIISFCIGRIDRIARTFFSEDKELHFFDVDGKKQAVAVSDEDGKDELVKEYEIAGKFGSIGSSVFVKEYIGYDEDGQANVVLTRLQGIK